MPADLILVVDLATQLGRHKTAVFKVLQRLGIQATKERSSANGGQFVSRITSEEAQLVAEEFSASITPADADEFEVGPGNESEQGVFYLIALEPEHDPGRFKLGFALNLSERLRKHRCAAPFAVVVQSWPCKRLWERTAIDCVSIGCTRLHTEVFRAHTLEAVVARCNQFFALMPSSAQPQPET